MKTHYEYRKELKSLDENVQKLLFFSSGAFFRTFDSDAKFLSALFGFNIVKNGGYLMAGFPKSATDKYFNILRFQDIAYLILEHKEGILMVKDENNGMQPLGYNPSQVCFSKEKSKEETPAEMDFRGLLQDLTELIQKYTY